MSFEGIQRMRTGYVRESIPALPLVSPDPLDVAADATFDAWVALPPYDLRTLEEFAADGGKPTGPPNRSVREVTLIGSVR